MAQDITKNSGDIENYSKEFLELQSQLNQVKQEKFNGISLFAQEATPRQPMISMELLALAATGMLTVTR